MKIPVILKEFSKFRKFLNNNNKSPSGRLRKQEVSREGDDIVKRARQKNGTHGRK